MSINQRSAAEFRVITVLVSAASLVPAAGAIASFNGRDVWAPAAAQDGATGGAVTGGASGVIPGVR